MHLTFVFWVVQQPILSGADQIKIILSLLLFAFCPLPAARADIGDQLAKLTSSDGATTDWFGHSVAISGNRALVGVPIDGDNGSQSGSAYLFDVTTGSQLAKMTPSDGAKDDRFGYSIALSGKTALVGAYGDDDNGTSSGSAYLFDITTGTQIAKLNPSDGTSSDRFGYSVALSGSTALVGAYADDINGDESGSAYLFDITTGSQIAKLTPSDGAELDWFGYSVAISGGKALVGAFQDDDNGTSSGSAYLFDATTGSQLAKLTPSDGAESDWFGHSVAISGNRALVGAFQDDDNGRSSGSAYLFDATTGSQLAKLTPSDGTSGDFFGFSVALSGNTAIVGGVGDDDNNGTSSGSAYLFDIATERQLAKLIPGDGAYGDWFGHSVALSGNTAFVGAVFEDNRNGIDSGSAYLFDATTIPEPHSLTLLFIGAVGLLIRHRN